MIFDDKTLKRLAEARPIDEDELLAINGIGPKKQEQYGEAVLGILVSHDK